MPLIRRLTPRFGRPGATGTALILAIAVALIAVVPSLAQEPPPPIAVEVLTQRAQLTDDVSISIRNKLDGQATSVSNMAAPSRTVVARITVQPGAHFPWHTHPGPVLVNVAQGELVYVQASDCIERSYPTGTAFVDPGRGNVHTAFNPTGGATVLYATFFEVPATGPLTITDGVIPGDCDVEVGSHASH